MSDDAQMFRQTTWTSTSTTEIDPATLDWDDIHLCLLPLTQPPSVLDDLATTLTVDEHERASRFRFDRDRHRFIVARGLLRRLLSRYAGASPDALRFAYGTFGKPYLETGANQEKVAFSLSHSGDWALVGLTRGREIGVDLEQVQTRRAPNVQGTIWISRNQISHRQKPRRFSACPRTSTSTVSLLAGRARRHTSRPSDWVSRWI